MRGASGQLAGDDGGFSGGSLDRPALQQLLEHIEARQVDCVMVYKVDRLSRSLLDFARLMDRFEQRSVSFVSVTQQFNTTTSLGRLTLNILLSFAQFEREIISERTRDKMSAARRKGKWVGGTPVLGYDVDPRGGRLVVNPSEARRVREIFELYRSHRSLAVVVAELAQRGWATKSWKSRRGIRHTGRPFTKASLRLLLTNATYGGNVNYRGVVYQGEHPAIIEPAFWEDVNSDFSERRRAQHESRYVPQNAPLSGLLICRHCQQPMIATYSAKGARRYRYYVCHTAREKGWVPWVYWLFGVPAEQIDVVIHPQSIVHSCVEMVDGSILAQLGPCDMRLPIQSALTYPRRVAHAVARLDLRTLGTLEFEAPDDARFPCLGLAREALRRKLKLKLAGEEEWGGLQGAENLCPT